MSPTRPLDAIREDAIAALRRSRSTEGEERTETLRTVAALLVEARGHFLTADGTVDWGGRTWACRRFSSEIFAAADLGENVSSVQAAIRYHVSNLLRERLDPEELEAAGLRKESARTRSVLKREKQAAVLATVGPGPALTSAKEITEALATVSTILARIPVDEVRTLAGEDRATVFGSARRVRDAAEALVGASAD